MLRWILVHLGPGLLFHCILDQVCLAIHSNSFRTICFLSFVVYVKPFANLILYDVKKDKGQTENKELILILK